MAATDSPRRILGERDINKSLIAKHFSSAVSPEKTSGLSPSKAVRTKCLDLENAGRQISVSPKLYHAAPTFASSLFKGKKRSVDCLGHVQDGLPRKQAMTSGEEEDREESKPQTEGVTLRSLATVVQGVDGTVEDKPSKQPSLCRSISPDSSFDATQDSENIDSQNTALTEPEDLPPLPLAMLTVTQPRLQHVSKEEARENAETLRLRLKVAIYKVQTNQTDLPLSRLQIRRPQTSSNNRKTIRTPLPTSRSSPGEAVEPVSTTLKHQLPPNVRSASAPRSLLSSPQQRDDDGEKLAHQDAFATPILPRSRDGLEHLHTQDTPAACLDLTSSVVKGRAADGLLSLMGTMHG